MKSLLVVLSLTVLAGCSTVAGTVRGAGEDVKQGADIVSNWIKPQQRN